MTEAEKLDFYRDAYEKAHARAEALEKSNTRLYEQQANHTEAYGMVCQERDRYKADALRYRWLRSEDTATNPLYYPFWQEFNVKLCRDKQMDALIDSAMTSRMVCPPPARFPSEAK